MESYLINSIVSFIVPQNSEHSFDYQGSSLLHLCPENPFFSIDCPILDKSLHIKRRPF
jgi:hypothetical protein